MAMLATTKALLALMQSIEQSPIPTPGVQPTNLTVAQQILRNADVKWSSIGQPDMAKPSVLTRVFDVLSRPGYAVQTAVLRAIDKEKEAPHKLVSDIVSGLGAGLRGDIDPSQPGAQKPSGAKILKELGVESKVARGIGGFAVDVLADPLTYIGAGAIKGVAKKAVGTKALPDAPKPALSVAIEEVPRAPEITKKGDISVSVGDFKAARSILDMDVTDEGIVFRHLAPKPKAYTPASAAEISVAQKTASEYLKRLKIKDKFVSPKQQVLLYNRLLKQTGNNTGRAVAMLNAAEEFMQNQGVGFRLWEGSKGKLSEFIDELGGPGNVSDDLLKSFQRGRAIGPNSLQAIENLRARSAMDDAPTVISLIEDIARRQTVADNVLSPPAARNIKDAAMRLPKVDVSPIGVQTTRKILENITKQKEGIFQITANKRTRTYHSVQEGDLRKIVDITSDTNRAKELSTGWKLKELGEQIEGNRALNTIAWSFLTWWRNPNVRPIQQANLVSTRSSTAARIRDIKTHIRGKTQAEINTAMRAAQGNDVSTDPLVKYLRDRMEELLSSSGIKDEVDSVVLRSGTLMKEVNRELGRLGQKYPALKSTQNARFTNKQIKDPLTGQLRDFSGVNWLKSWEVMQSDRPQELLFGIQQAIENVTKQNAFWDDLAGRWGSKIAQGDFTHTIKDIPRLKGWHFTEEMAKEVSVAAKTIRELYRENPPLLKMYDRALSSWKRGVTIYVPSHHIRNMIGDVTLSWFAGVNDPRVYSLAGKVIAGNRHKYEGENLKGLLAVNAREQAVGKGKPLFRTKGGVDVTDEMITVNAHHQGLLLSARQAEDIWGDELFGDPSKFPVTHGRVHEFASKASEMREHYALIAHFIHAVRKQDGKDLGKIFENAGREVRKWHPNSTDLTVTERHFFRRVFPFYSWTRKAIPLIVESVIFEPRKVLAFPRAIQAGQVSLGIETPGIHDPFPTDQGFPDWYREQAWGPLGLRGMPGLGGLIGGLGKPAEHPATGEILPAYTSLFQRTVPVHDIFSTFTPNPLEGVQEQFNPALRLITELAQGKRLTGQPVSADPFRYTAEQIPIVQPLYNILNKPGARTGRAAGQTINLEALINTLTALGIRGSGPFIRQG